MKGIARNERIEKISKALEENGADLFITSIPHEIYYFTNSFVEGFFIYGSDLDALYTSKLYDEMARKESLAKDFFSSEKDYLAELKSFLSKFKGKKTLISSQESLSTYLFLKKCGLKIKPVDTQFFRIKKDKGEIEAIKKAYEIIEKAIGVSLEVLKEGVSELDLKAEITYRIRRNGGEGDSFDHIVVFGSNSSIPHARSGNRKLKKGDLILIDAGARYQGYCSDITRCFFFGKADEEVLKAYRILLEAKKRAEDALEDGILLKKVDSMARGVLKKANLDKYFTHGLGHGIGLEIHERPILSPKSKDKLEKNLAFTIEPGIYFEGIFGLRVEDGYIFDEKPVKLSKFTEEIMVI